MCGIVGYAGARPALGIVLDGLRRLEYRGYDSAGVAVVCDGELLHREARRQARPTSRRRSADRGSAAARDGESASATAPPASGTPAGPPTAAPTDRNAHPHRSADGRVAVIHNGIIENFAKLRAELEAEGRRVRQRHRHRVRRPPARRRAGRAARRRRAERRSCSPRRCAGSASRLDGAFTLLAVDARHPGRGGRRPAQLAAGRRPRRRGELPGQRRLRVHRAHPRRGRAGPGPGRADHRRTASRSPTSTGSPPSARTSTSTGTPRPPRRAATTTSCSRRSPSSRRRSPTRCSAGSTATGEIMLDEVRLSDQDLRDVDKVFIVACGTRVPRRAGRQVRHRALDPHPVRGRAGQRVPLPRPGAGPLHAGAWRSPSRARRWTR